MNDVTPSSVIRPSPAWKLPPSWAWIVAAGLVAHGLVLLTDYVLWDGWWYAADLVRPDGPVTMARLFHEVGRPIDMWFYEPLRWFGGSPVAWAKWLGTAAWIAAAVCISVVLRRLARLPEGIATAVAVLVAVLPIFDLLGELALWMNTACVLLFWGAWVLVSRLTDLGGWRAIMVRVAALAMFFVSFDLNSNLVMFYAVAVAMAGLRLPDARPATLLAKLPQAALRHADFLVLPLVFWTWKTWFTPTSGFYATGYNQPSLNPLQLAAGYLGVLLDFMLRGLIEFVAAPKWLAAAAVAAIATVAGLRHVAARAAVVERPLRTGLRLLGWGTFLLLAAAFPYIVVGQPLASEGWLTRNCILCPLPVAMITCGLILLGTGRWADIYPRAWIAVTAAVVTLGVGGCVHNYLAYQALGAKAWSIRGHLGGMIRDSDAAVVQLRDYCRIPRTIPYYPPIIWTFLANGSADPPQTLVIETVTLGPDISQPGSDGQPRRIIPRVPLRAETVDETITDTTMPYALERIPRVGPQILVTAEPGYEGASAIDLGIRYLFLSWLEPDRLPEFVRGFIKAESHALPPIQ